MGYRTKICALSGKRRRGPQSRHRHQAAQCPCVPLNCEALLGVDVPPSTTTARRVTDASIARTLIRS